MRSAYVVFLFLFKSGSFLYLFGFCFAVAGLRPQTSTIPASGTGQPLVRWWLLGSAQARHSRALMARRAVTRVTSAKARTSTIVLRTCLVHAHVCVALRGIALWRVWHAGWNADFVFWGPKKNMSAVYVFFRYSTSIVGCDDITFPCVGYVHP